MGDLRGVFQTPHPNMVMSLWEKSIVKLMVIVIPVSFLGFYLLIKKTLRHLDPTTVVPERVKVALDSLVEGVVLMDDQERIVMVNKSFENKIGGFGEPLVGQKASTLNWTDPRSRKQVKDYPWQQAMSSRVCRSSVAMSLNDQEGDIRTFMVNGAPILDGSGKTRGALATFDDITTLEEQNTQLQQTLNALKRSRDAVHKQNRVLQILATKDPLTNCLNRRAFFERFEAEFSRAERHKHDLSCVMVDIDHFKSINDNHGHPFGDKVLRKMSEILRGCLRDSDIICRYGGEEFCILLPETGRQGGHTTAERIRATVASKLISGVQITVSLGLSSLESNPGNPSELLSQADKALYKAKRSGRNSVVCHSGAIDRFFEQTPQESENGESNRNKVSQHIPHHVVKALMLALEHRDVPTAEHSRKVGDLCVATAHELMSMNECFVLEIAGMLHDIGKLGVPDSILLKPGPLTADEWAVMRDHERRSVDVIASTFLSPELVEIVKYHSYWYDGSSTDDPSQPKGKDIPLGARILNIADAFDAIVSNRPYRKARSYEEAYKELRRCSGSQFDPDLVEHFIKVVSARDESRRERNSSVTNSVKLEIGREIEELLVAVNASSYDSLSLSAENLVAKATKYGFNRIAEVAMKIETAAVERSDEIQVMELASELMELCTAKKGTTVDSGNDQGKTLAA